MLENHLQFNDSLVDKCLEDPDIADCTARTYRDIVLDHDTQLLLNKAKHHPEASIIGQISNSVSWIDIWDRALDYGVRGTNRIQFLIKILTHPSFKDAHCPMCKDIFTSKLITHFHSNHPICINSDTLSTEDLLNLFTTDDIFNIKFTFMLY